MIATCHQCVLLFDIFEDKPNCYYVGSHPMFVFDSFLLWTRNKRFVHSNNRLFSINKFVDWTIQFFSCGCWRKTAPTDPLGRGVGVCVCVCGVSLQFQCVCVENGRWSGMVVCWCLVAVGLARVPVLWFWFGGVVWGGRLAFESGRVGKIGSVDWPAMRWELQLKTFVIYVGK